jgi:hypothetical protein
MFRTVFFLRGGETKNIVPKNAQNPFNVSSNSNGGLRTEKNGGPDAKEENELNIRKAGESEQMQIASPSTVTKSDDCLDTDG